MNLTNLQRIRDYINDHVTDDKFNMLIFREDNFKLHTCDSVGCVLGHATGCLTEEEFKKIPRNYLGDIDFFEWAKEFLGLPYNIWDFLFSPQWATIYPSRTDAIKRMDYVLKHGEAPEDWSYVNSFGGADDE